MPDPAPLPPQGLAAEALRRGRRLRRRRQYARRATTATLLVGVALAVVVGTSGRAPNRTSPTHRGTTTTTTVAPHLPPWFRWTAPQSIDSHGVVSALSCVSPLFCVAVDDMGYVMRYNGKTWTPPELVGRNDNSGAGGDLDGVSCVSRSFCVAVGTRSGALVFDGRSWRPSLANADPVVTSVSCASARFCVAVDGQGYALVYDGSTWGPRTLVNQLGLLNSVSCPDVSFCVAVGPTNFLTYNGSSWTSVPSRDSLGEPFSVSCPSRSFCATVDGSGYAMTFDGRSWSAPRKAVPAGNGQLGQPGAVISCAASSFCVAASFYGYTSAYEGTAWGPASKVALGDLAAVSCPTPSFCGGIVGEGWIRSQ